MRPALLLGILVMTVSAAQAQPLPSWNDTDARRAIVDFVGRVTRDGGPDHVPPAERIAVFDNDGTLWAEQPMYFQIVFAVDRVKALAPDHPEWKGREPFASAIRGDIEGALAGGKSALLELVTASHAGQTASEFRDAARAWLDTARHPRTGRPYTEMVYQPMLELLDYLRANGFKTFITSGGGIDFIRVFAEETYGIPPEQVIGSSLKSRYEVRDGVPVIVKLPELNFNDDKAGKPVAIHQHIGRRPIAAFGNSDGDFEMLEWTSTRQGPSLAVIVHHTDADREWAYDRDSHIGRLVRGLDEGPGRGWVLIDMKKDWSRVFSSMP